MNRQGQHSPCAYFAAGAASVVLLRLITSTLKAKPKLNYPTTIAAPLWQNDPEKYRTLAYPPQSLIPGARDVPTPYGSLRVYEFGPEDAKHKVLLVHGISTPCISLLGIAEDLAYKKGCRVMLFDLFGRGWSGGPPDLPYDARLYTSQILIALASSPIAWTGAASGGFALVGYSLGGCIVADFTSWFPDLVKDLVLIAPAGVMRAANVDLRTRLLYSEGIFPESWLQSVVKRRLRVMPNVTGKQKATSAERGAQGPASERKDAEAAPSAELPEHAVIETSRGEIDIESAVNWQMDNHEGFMGAFMSSIRHAPVRDQQERWSKIGARQYRRQAVLETLADVEPSHEEHKHVLSHSLNNGKVLVIFGGKDKIVKVAEVGPDAQNALGAQNVEQKTYANAGHEVPISCAEEIAKDIWEHLQGAQR